MVAEPHNDNNPVGYVPHNYSEVFDVALTPQGDLIIVGLMADTAIFGTTRLLSPGRGSVFVVKLAGATGQPVWAQQLTSPVSLYSNGCGVEVDPAGNVYVSGTYSQSITCGPTTLTSAGEVDTFVASLTGAGQWRWAKSAGGPGRDMSNQIMLDPAGNVCLSGVFQTGAVFGTQTLTSTKFDVYLATLAPTGQWLTAENLTHATDSLQVAPFGLATGPHGQLYVGLNWSNPRRLLPGSITIGSTTLTVPARSQQRALLAQRDSAGQWTWMRQLRGALTSGVACDKRGNVYVGGVNGDTLWVDSTVRLTPHSLNAAEAFTMSFSAAGDYQWVCSSDSSRGTIQPKGLSTGAPGEVYLQGSLQGWFDFGSFMLEAGLNFDVDLFVIKGAGPAPFNLRMGFSPTVATVGQPVTLSVNLPGGLTGLTSVTLNGVPITTYLVNANGQLVFTVPTSATTGTISLTVNGQIYTSTMPLTVQRTTGVAEAIDAAPLQLYPNPAREQVRISGGAVDAPVQLLDALGRVVRVASQANVRFDLRGLPAGVYVMRRGAQARRLVIE